LQVLDYLRDHCDTAIDGVPIRYVTAERDRLTREAGDA
jgi:hypothetical protein